MNRPRDVGSRGIGYALMETILNEPTSDGEDNVFEND